MRILAARTDKLGDMLLAWPALALLRQALPGAEIEFLVSSYTAEIAALCPYIDDVVVDRGGRTHDLAARLRARNYDASISMFNTARVGWSLYRAGIPYRLGPATKASQVFLNERLIQRRSQSKKPEYKYNEDLVAKALSDLCGYKGLVRPPRPYLQFPPTDLRRLRLQIGAEVGIEPGSFWTIVHPGSGGSANNLSTWQYADLINRLDPRCIQSILVTAGPGELEIAKEVCSMVTYPGVGIYHSTGGIVPFAKLVAAAGLLISGSTGPLHLAGVLNKATAGFYPAKRSSTALRWQTPNDPANRLSFQPRSNAKENDMSMVDLVSAANQISALTSEITKHSSDE